MKFCPKCGSILIPKKQGEIVMSVCRCGYSESGESKIKEVVKHHSKEIEVVDREIEVHPIAKTKCPKCKNEDAYFWEVQTRAPDEAATVFFKCVKCKHQWREYK